MTNTRMTATPAAAAMLEALIPARARDKARDWEAYCALIDQEATAHLIGRGADSIAAKRVRRRPSALIDDCGELTLRIPLDSQGRLHALVHAEDWIELQEAGFNGLWCANDNGRGRFHVKMHRPMSGENGRANTVCVARLIQGLGSRQQVRFLNGKTLDLRRANIAATYLTASPAAGRARYDARSVVRQGVQRRAKAVAEGRAYDFAAGA